MTQERIEAAHRVIAETGEWTGSDEQMQNVFAAADAVMFSDEAIERAVEVAMDHRTHVVSGRCICGEFGSKAPLEVTRHIVRAVVTALKGDA